MKDEILTAAMSPEPARISRLKLPGRIAGFPTVRNADLALIAQAPAGFLDTTHFDTTRFPVPPWAEDAIIAAVRDGEAAYSPYRGHAHVLASVAANVSMLLGIPIDGARNVILTPGTQAGLLAAISALADGRGPVALTAPEYLFDERMLRFLDVDIIRIPLLLDECRPDLNALEAAFRGGAQVFVFSHPSNPTGMVYSPETILRIAALAQEHDVTIIADELYCRLVYGDMPFQHIAAFPGLADRTVTLLGPSKTESLSGFRLGVAIAPPHLIDRMENVLSITALRAPAYAQSLLQHWLADDEDWLADRMQDFAALRDMTRRKLQSLPWLKMNVSMGTAYAWPDVSALGLDSYTVASHLLRDAGVLVSPGYQFGPDQEGHFRVCYARDEQTWSEALDRMVGVLEKLACS